MTTAADVITALNQRRKRFSNRPDVPGQMPPGWQAWFDAMPVLGLPGHAASPQAFAGVFAARPLREIPRAPAAMTGWQAFAHLLQQNWTPDDRQERGLRIGVTAIDIVMHLFLAGLLLWLMYLHVIAMGEQQAEDQVVQVEFIGRGNAQEGGGAIAHAGAESGPASAAPAQRAATPAPVSGRPEAAIEQVAMPSPPTVADSASSPAREPTPPAALEAAQPLQVSEVATPEPRSFQLPPPKLRDTPQPQLELREVAPAQQVEEIATVRPQQVRTLQPRESQAAVRIPDLQNQPREIDVPAPQRMATVQARSAPAQATREAQVAVPQFRGEVREIPMPPGGAPMPSAQAGSGTSAQANPHANGAGGERGAAPVAGQAHAGTGQGARPAEQGGRGVTATGNGAGSANKPAPGGWPGQARSDDWGASSRTVAGTGNGSGKTGEGSGKPGLFDKDGSVRLPDEWTQVSGIDTDRSGTWLKRPGLEYRGTRFDQYWIPEGTLLQEWVRRGIKKIAIPIPGSKRRLECVVSLLQLGGGCFPVNPDANEQPATARPPPDIPFKLELQEDNGSRPPAGG